MNPKDEDSKEMSMELPTPVDSNTPSEVDTSMLPSTEEGHAKALEQGIAQPTQPVDNQQASASDDSSKTNDDNTDAATDANSATTASGVVLPQIADDNDLIEKEWVEKAKQIVDKTKDDPYLQNRELGNMRADYMKKRYNKDIKLVE